MAKQSDVSIKLNGLDGVTPTGITVSYQLGQVPTAAIDLAPDYPGVVRIFGNATGVLRDVDSAKRKQEITVNLSVGSWVGLNRSKATKTTRTLAFTGLLDGMSVGNMVGGNSYQAILKGKAQTLLELTTYMPGLYPSSINIFKTPSLSQTANTQGSDESSVAAWTRLTVGENSINPSSGSPIEVYTKLIRAIIENQQSGWQSFQGRDITVDGQIPFAKIFEDSRYKAALARAKTLFSEENLDLSGVKDGSFGSRTGASEILTEMQRAFTGGSNVLLENYMSFLSMMGCTIVFGNNKMFVVPVNSMIKQDYTAPGPKQLQTKINHAHPADYSGYSYNDNGYRDIAHVMVVTRGLRGNTDITSSGNFSRGDIAHFSEQNNITQASGVLVVSAHPFLLYSPFTPTVKDAKETKQAADSAKKDMQGGGSSDDAEQQKKEDRVAREAEKEKHYVDSLRAVMSNYAETKFYQARYADRQGSITMDFNPNWVPGTSGTLYIRETGNFIAFYVTGVTHRIEMSVPHSGHAITSITFCCGRMGASPPGVDADLFLGYNLAKEQAIQAAFVADIGGA